MMPAAPPSPIPLVAQLASALRDAGVLYCHWKSNASIELAERGQTDLDLLIARHQVTDFGRVLSSCGFAAAERIGTARLPGVADFFGYDPTVDRFVHVHAHYQLVLGHDRTKNYHLPIEQPYLASASTSRVLPTPSEEFEYVVFVLRMVLKYAIVDEILWSAVRGRRAGPKPSERDEFLHLAAAVDPEVVDSILREHLPFVDAELFAAAEAVTSGRTSVGQGVAVARRVQSTLEAYTRSRPSIDAMLRVWRRTVLLVRRRTGGPSGYRLAGGGAIVAIMGGDGAGKSTAIETIGEWLGHDFAVLPIHLGKPPWSLTTYAVRGSLKLADAAAAAIRGRADAADQDFGGDSPALDYRRTLWFACKARDRYLEYRRARRAANRGGIVISDRFPHPALRLMDRPQIERLAPTDSGSRFVEGLSRLETRYDRVVALPEVAIVLRLDPEEAARRKTDEPYDYVVARSTEVWGIDWTETSVYVVDASQSRETVAAEIKTLIWSSLA